VSLNVFIALQTAEEDEIAEQIRSKGGIEAVKSQGNLLRQILEYSVHHEGEDYSNNNDQHERISVLRNLDEALKDLYKELYEEVDAAISAQAAAFEKKYNLAHSQLQRNMKQYIQEEGKRLVDELNKGPHDLIRDDVRAVVYDKSALLRTFIRIFITSGKKWYAQMYFVDTMLRSGPSEMAIPCGNKTFRDSVARLFPPEIRYARFRFWGMVTHFSDTYTQICKQLVSPNR
jgi:hypothetical protein